MLQHQPWYRKGTVRTTSQLHTHSGEADAKIDRSEFMPCFFFMCVVVSELRRPCIKQSKKKIFIINADTAKRGSRREVWLGQAAGSDTTPPSHHCALLSIVRAPWHAILPIPFKISQSGKLNWLKWLVRIFYFILFYSFFFLSIQAMHDFFFFHSCPIKPPLPKSPLESLHAAYQNENVTKFASPWFRVCLG